ncbi:metal-dependent hydrolase [Dysgonomonas sp. GY617]|uniref:metal-dependent hydrolase n=1 Tax=Dysgonomonas sp. GY617 TaxID=2780420 RepID=UPI001883E79A|nr:metal-dependent hydrolase [Dysgonomonas sp. GY617]MBF0576246.1 metal-dependent hydrolase [Dysgonomonas sp. GY617]
MDILTHALSGAAIGTVVANYNQMSSSRKAKTVLAGAVGGTFPDIDAISMWSGFDRTLGSLFNLEHSARVIYGSKFWYSHHAFFHSLIGSLLVAVLFLLLIYIVMRKYKTIPLLAYFKASSVFFIAFVLGYWAHLAGDLPTPSSVWGGISLFWPSDNYVGGYGKIWWWNNYDIFLLILFCVILNLLLPAISKYVRIRSRVCTISIATITLSLILVQINTRHYNYSYAGNRSNYTQMEQNSKLEQKRILGDRIYYYMDKFDKRLKINF